MYFINGYNFAYLRFMSITIQGMDINGELINTVDALVARKKMFISVRKPPTRRQKTSDRLCRCLATLAKCMVKQEIDIRDLFPKLEKERNSVCNAYDIVELIKVNELTVLEILESQNNDYTNFQNSRRSFWRRWRFLFVVSG